MKKKGRSEQSEKEKSNCKPNKHNGNKELMGNPEYRVAS